MIMDEKRALPTTDETAAPTTQKRGSLATILVLLFVLIPAVAFLGGNLLGIGGSEDQNAFQMGVAAANMKAPGPRKPRLKMEDPHRAFDLGSTVVPREEIREGGPPKNGIPSLTNPPYITAQDAKFLGDDESVIGVNFSGEARAYPLRLMDMHEAVNDVIGGIPVAITYCPLCDSSVVFDRRVEGETVELGISGLLFNSNVLLFDRQKNNQPESLWSQLKAESINGKKPGRNLKTLPLKVTTWSHWRSQHPQTQVLYTSVIPPGRRYSTYLESPRPAFPVKILDDRLPPKSQVLGIWTEDGAARAFSIRDFQADGAAKEITEQIDGRSITLAYHPQAKSLQVVRADEGVNWMYAFWFAWHTFNPETELFANPVEH